MDEVQSCLKELLQKLQVHNYTITVSQGCSKGCNFMGTIVKTRIVGTDSQGKEVVHNFIIKKAPRDEAVRRMVSIAAVYEREEYTYRRILHEFDVLQREKCVKEPFQAYAKYYDSLMSNMDEFLILEDLSERGFEIHDRQRPLNYDHTLLVLKAYAKLHALSFAMRRHKPTLLMELAKNEQEKAIDTLTRNENNAFLQISQKVLLLLDPVEEKTLYERFKNFQKTMFNIVEECVTTDLSNPEFVILHGDCWTNNFMFKYHTTSRTPLAVCILDWQLSHYGSPALDLSYFIFICTDKNLRDEHYATLIKEYYKAFSNFLRELGGDPQDEFSFETLQRHLKRYSVYGLFIAILGLLIITSNIKDIPDDVTFLNGKFLDALDYNSKNMQVYNRKIKNVLIDFERLGYDF